MASRGCYSKDMTKTPDTQSLRRFKRTLTNLESVLYRQTKGQGWSTTDPAAYCRDLWQMVRDFDDVADTLDNDPKLAARFARAERRAYGLRP